jgi:hypothetical protein
MARRTAPPPARPARAVRSPAELRAARRAARNRALRRDGLLLAVVVVVLAAIWPQRLVANEDLPLARELTAEMDAIAAAVRAGELELADEPALVPPPDGVASAGDGVRGMRISRPTGDRWVVTGVAGRDCYAMWWDEDGTRRARTVPSTLPCEPATSLTLPRPDTYDRVGQAAREDSGVDPWARVLPDPWRYRFWFLPAVIVLAGVGLSAMVRMTIALLIDDAPKNVRR